MAAVAFAAAYAQMRTTERAGAQNAGGGVDTEGNLRVPDDYRTAYQFLGIWAVADDKGKGSKEVHVVFASPGTVAAYQKDGQFADGSVLVKEVFETPLCRQAAPPTNRGSHGRRTWTGLLRGT
jgi:Cytochrome P460